jgi:hypothetical protein
MGLSYAVRERHKDGKEIAGQWLRAQKFLAEFHEYTFQLQNADGSFSTGWFERRDDQGTLDRKLNTTGHILEWLVYSLSREQLDDPRLVKGVGYLVDLMWQHRGHPWEVGPKGHAIHALSMYDERVFGGRPGQRAVELAESRYPSSTESVADSAPAQPAAETVQAPEVERAGGSRRRLFR